MTATISSTTQVVSEWVKIFPKQATENYTSSVTFMKQLTVVAISTITYLKSVFPEDSYVVESFGGIKLRIIKKKCQDECAQFLSTSLSQAFEAFDKRYLHQLALCFYEEDCSIENLIEYHIFDYSYHGDGVTMNVLSKNRENIKQTAKFTFENVRERTIHMIRSCVVLMQSCQNELPSTYNVSLRLYYNEDTPWDYQAPGFLSTDETEDHLAGSLAETVRLGWVETSFHKLVARSYIKDTARASHEAIASQNPPVIASGELEKSASTPGGGPLLRCPCNVPETAEGSRAPPALLACQYKENVGSYCGTAQHATCYGVRAAHAALVSRHCCAACHDADRARPPTDGKMAALSDRKRECLCIFRRTLEWCSRRAAVGGGELVRAFGVSELNALKLMKLLKSHKIIDLHDENDYTAPQKIQEERLDSVVDKFFQSSSEENIVDRLLAETFASQESLSDPISEVLSPLERVSLSRADGAGPVDVATGAGPADVTAGAGANGAALQRYREAILGGPGEELAALPPPAVQQRTVKRRAEEGRTVTRLGLRSSVRSKRVRTDRD